MILINELNNLPNFIKKNIIKNDFYSAELNNLPNSTEYLELPLSYQLEIKNISANLKTIQCSKNYKYIDTFKNIEILTEYI